MLETTYETFTRTFQDWPYPGMEGFETVVRTIAQMDERAAGRTAASSWTCGSWTGSGPRDWSQRAATRDPAPAARWWDDVSEGGWPDDGMGALWPV